MEGTYSFFVLFLLSTSTTVFATNCYGGSILQTTVVGGNSDDYYNDAVFSNNEIFAVGGTYSDDFPYDDGYTADEVLSPQDAILVSSYVSNTTNKTATIFSSYGDYDTAYSVDADGDYLCIAGVTNGVSSFPSNADGSYWSNSEAAWLFVLNKTSTPFHERIISGVFGDNFGVSNAYVACSAKNQIAFLVSTSGYGVSFKRGYNDYDVRITMVDLIDGGDLLADLYYGGTDDDYVQATDFLERSSDKFLMIAGSTYSSGIEDSFPIANAYQSTNNGSRDLFVWVANMDLINYNNTWQFATFFGGSGYDYLLDATFDESGNVYVVGGSESSDFPLKNAFNSTYCGSIENLCLFLSIFNLQGKLLFSSWMGINQVDTAGIAVQRLSDGGHLVYITTATYNLEVNTVESFQYNITNSTLNNQDSLITVIYVSAQFDTSQVRLQSFFGGTDYDVGVAISVLPNNRFAVSGYTTSYDLPQAGNYSNLAPYNIFTTTFQCGQGLYAVNPSPTPAASIPPPSPPPVSCDAASGCYNVPGIYVQFEEGDDGEYTPSQSIFPGTDTEVEENYYLDVEYLSLEEKNSAGNLVVSVPFPDSGYTLTSESQVINGVNVNVVTFSTYLLNGAGVDVINYFFEESGTLDFAGTTITVAESTSKVSLKIYGWNFEDPSNTLTLTILLDIAPTPKGPASETPSGNQTQFTWDTGATDCVVTTLSVIEIDGSIGTSTFSVTSSTLKATFPSFVDYVLYDPGYQVLVKEEDKKSSKEEVSPWAYVGAALGAVVVVTAAVAGGYVFMSHQRRRTERALTKRPTNVEMT